MTEQAIYFAAVISEYESDAELTVLAQLNSETNSTGRYCKQVTETSYGSLARRVPQQSASHSSMPRGL